MSDPSEDAFALLEAGAATGLVARDTDVLLSAGPVQHALDSKGRRHLLIPLGEGQADVEDLSSQGVTVRPHEFVDRDVAHRYLDVTCEMPALRDLFAVVCDETLERLVAHPSAPGRACIEVLERWRELIRGPADRLLSREALSGLLAELHVLERLAALDPRASLTVWTGPAKGRADFTGGNIAVEVKATTARERLTVEIHGATQLDAVEGTALFLMVERQEQVPLEGDSVPDAVRRLLDLGVDAANLMRSIEGVGYSPADTSAYARVRFRTLGTAYVYAVLADFPRIGPASFLRPEVLERVTELRYTLDLTVRPPTPLPPDDVNMLMRRMVGMGQA